MYMQAPYIQAPWARAREALCRGQDDKDWGAGRTCHALLGGQAPQANLPVILPVEVCVSADVFSAVAFSFREEIHSSE